MGAPPSSLFTYSCRVEVFSETGLTVWESEETIRATEEVAERSRSQLAEATGETVAVWRYTKLAFLR